MLDDWRLDRRAQIVGDFGNLHDASHQGRVGNTPTVNGRETGSRELARQGKVWAINGAAPLRDTWRDTLLMAPRSRATVAMVADNPGRWMLHCHIPEHQEAGMMAVVNVD